MEAPLPYYRRVSGEQLQLSQTLQRRYDRLAIVRLLVFFAVVALLILAWSGGVWWGLTVTLVAVTALTWGVRAHLRIGKRADGARVQHELAEAEIRGLHHDFRDRPDGAQYSDATHPYATDLDLFGPYSLYQFLNRTVTAVGSRRLADQLLKPAPVEVADARRREALALVPDPDWCLEWRQHGADLHDKDAYAARLLEWVERPPVVTGRFAHLMRWAAVPLSLTGLWFCFTQEPWQLGLLFFVPAFLLLRRLSEPAAIEHAYTASAGRALAGYARLLAHLEDRYRPESPEAAPAITRLGYYVSQLDVRHNPFVFVLEITGLWSLHWLYRLDRWRTAHRHDLPRWLEELAEVDARVSWATLRFNRPEWTEAEFTEEPILEGEALGHPLLAPEVRVTNDIRLQTDGHIHLVTGSNMAGKSTWLRTVGLNLVLARAGGPVCARHLRTAALQVWTSMRTHDDLSESTSSFYAELKRLKAIIEAVSDPEQQVLFLLDEILKGTNSRDRHTGARALIRQLIRERGAGIIATHDLELAALENEDGPAGHRVENYAMEVQTRDGELTFDYKLHRGVSRSFNATALMARMGIQIDPEDIKLTHD
ncbi:MutS-related protein [Neolewinella litorea]|uniref:DNA mismatch repair proteins mutS family domain-containing protein n=1 Tax=Neolewinella litorea TaxID=2562452 RepID=A0A4V3XLS4_9BACT|nr:hypothetical protein [Neolewinella litorea]THH41963.1 hypothetical protein E4021_05090 [Neolewinella litorea]